MSETTDAMSENAPKGEASGSSGSSSSRPKRSGASLTELELAFAQDPQSTAYIPLCEAYLEQGRFMEAMVVCKKGLKAHPSSVEAKVLLANVYAKQQKFARALQELDEVVKAHATSGLAFLGRAKIRLDSGDEKGAVADLKKAIDLDKSLDEATELLKKRGIVYPEPVVVAPPQQQMMPQPRMQSFVVPPGAGAAPVPRAQSSMSGGMSGTPSTIPPAPMQGQSPMGSDLGPSAGWNDGAQMRGPSGVMLPPMGRAPSMGGYPQARPRLEGEEELEALAKNVATETQEKRGNPKTFFAILIGGVLTVLIAGAVMFSNKRTTEGIAELSKSARIFFLDDTYGKYKRAAADYEKILDDYDEAHGPTLGSLAHVSAILWGEHGESERKGTLDKTLPLAEKHGADNPHTISARGLALLYGGGENRQKAAAAAYEAMWPSVKQLRETQGGVGSYADLTLGIVDIELGNYESAQDTLGQVASAMPGSVRAKVWYARASHKAGHLDKAEIALSEALRVAKDHSGALAGRALVRVQRGKLELAAADLVAFDDFVTKYPKEVSVKDVALAEYARSEVFRAGGENNAAVAAYDRAVKLDKNNADFPYGLGRALLKQGRNKEALEPLRKAVQMEPNRRAFLIGLAEAETEVGEYDAASQHIEGALKPDPRDLNAVLAKARLLRAQKKPETEAFLKDVLDWSKGSPEANLELGRYYRAVGRAKEARELLEKAVNEMDRLPPVVRGEVLVEFGKLSAEENDDVTAYNSFKQAGEFGMMEGWYRAIQILAKTGKRDKEALKTACDRYLNAGQLPNTNDAKAMCQ